MTKIPTYLDGVLQLYEDVSVRSDFGAKINEADLVSVCSNIPFAEMMHRQSDIDFAEASGFSLSRKVKIRYCPLFQKLKKYKVIIDHSLYDVSYIDISRVDSYLYLEYIREVVE